MATKEALGMSMTISEDFIQNLAKELVSESLIKTLDGRDKIAEEIVRQVIGKKVDKRTGEPTNSDYCSCTFLEYQIRKLLSDEIVLVTKEVMEERRPEIRELIRSELRKKATLDKFFNAFYDVVIGNLDTTWRTNITFNIEKEGDY